MSVPARVTAPAITKLTAALNGFLATNSLPDPAAVTLDPHCAGFKIQPDVTAYQDPVAVLSALLLWSRGLSAPRATWWLATENQLHISIAGRLSCGVSVAVYKGLPYDTVREWVLLGREEHDSVSLDELAWLIRQLHTARPAV